jgi:maltose O-acetyltransferase
MNVRARFDDLLLSALGALSVRLEKARERRLKTALAFCGQGVRIRQPTVIEVPRNVSIEDHVSIASFVHMWGNGGIRIGPRTMIASHVAITSATHDPDAPFMSTTSIAEPVTIENDVWIGSHSVIFPGVTIGAHAVIAAGSVVRSDVAPHTIVAGVPARFIRDKRSCGDVVNGKAAAT